MLNSPKLDDNNRCRLAEKLREIDPGNQNAIDSLVLLLHSSHISNYIHWRVVVNFEKFGFGNQKAVDTLMELLNFPHLDDDTRRRVAESLGKIDPGNQKARDTLMELLNFPHLDNQTRRRVAESLGKIDPGNQKAIDTLMELLNSSKLDEYDRCKLAKILREIDPGNQNAIDTLVQCLSSPDIFDYFDYETHEEITESLKKIQKDKQFAVIKTLKANFNKSQEIDDYCYELIWHYAQNLTYPDFYQSWHQDTLTNTATENLNIANLPQVLAEAINNQPELCSKVKLICIDTHQFIDPENPAPEIYDLMLNQKCPEWQNGYPETMQKLKLYWNSLHRNSKNPLFFICYDSTALTATPTGFSLPFLTALSKFDGAICVVSEKVDIPLQTFSPSQPNLIADIVGWMMERMLEE
ncbi:HEAT repeat domain-containing protein [Planktothrix sp. PCC 11201]|uniref:HEAT repeat domain-containing protein n=1 Tax=Planktothrix sp. PCC 11201 TaxID=1729650 RepID=UPI00117DBCE9|nr:HEAT repeat domain-containing protein [Planktothrix sp. PCC 11201]